MSEITDEIVQFSYAASLIGNTTTEPLERGKRYADPYRSYFPTESPFPSVRVTALAYFCCHSFRFADQTMHKKR